MGGRRVVLLSCRSLLAAALEKVLDQHTQIEFRIVRADDPQAAANIRAIAPHVIVVDTGDAVTGQTTIFDLLEQHPLARVVAVSLERNDIEIYRMSRVHHTTPEGLFQAIHGKRARRGGEKDSKDASAPNV